MEHPTPEPLGRPIGKCVQMAFPTPIIVHEWQDSDALNAALCTLILADEAANTSLSRSNVGGWHSGMDFIERDDPAIHHLLTRIRTLLSEATQAMMKADGKGFRIEGWANVLRKGQYNSIHVHPNSTWSGVYYVTGNPPPEPPGTPEFSGKIEFIDPRPAASATYTVENMMQQRTMLNPGPGTMIAFPSWLQHLVHPYFGPGERISVAFNMLIA